MKTPKCKMCDGTGNVHVEGPFISQPVDLPCWICGAANFKGMSRDQVSWYLKMHKALDAMKCKSLRAGEVVSPAAWLTMKNAINLACSRLKISTQAVTYPKATQYGETNAFLHMREEFREFERRLAAIPGAVAAKVVS
jgi:hypothetical protein